MYEELIKQCQGCLDSLCGECKYEHLQKAGNFVRCMNALLGEATNAIERLSSLVDHYGGETGIKNLNEFAGKYWDALAKIPCWISVTEALPKKEKKRYWICTNTGYQCECRWTNNRFGIGESDEWGWSIFDIPQYQNVVAWMPLPDSYKPKEET